MRVITGGAVLLASLLPALVQAQSCYYGCGSGNYCYQGSCYPYNPGPPPPNPCYNNPYGYACQNYCYYHPYDPYCPGPPGPPPDPCIRQPWLPYCDPCQRNPYAPGCPDPFAPIGGNPFTGDNHFINNFNPLGMFGSSDASKTAPPPPAAGLDLAASDAQAPPPPAAAAPGGDAPKER